MSFLFIGFICLTAQKQKKLQPIPLFQSLNLSISQSKVYYTLYISIYTYTPNMLNNLIFSILSNILYTLNVHFIYTNHTLIVHISKEKWEFLGRKVELWME